MKMQVYVITLFLMIIATYSFKAVDGIYNENGCAEPLRGYLSPDKDLAELNESRYMFRIILMHPERIPFNYSLIDIVIVVYNTTLLENNTHGLVDYLHPLIDYKIVNYNDNQYIDSGDMLIIYHRDNWTQGNLLLRVTGYWGNIIYNLTNYPSGKSYVEVVTQSSPDYLAWSTVISETIALAVFVVLYFKTRMKLKEGRRRNEKG